MRNFKKLTLLLIVLTLSACGFTMRGEVNIPPQIKKISVTSNEYSSLVNTLNTSLVNSNIEVVTNLKKELYRIIIVSENFNRRQLSIGISGRVNEYELIYDVIFEINKPNEKSSSEKITLYRDYSYDEDNMMGNTDREERLKDEMISTASTLIFNKLIAKVNSEFNKP